MNKRILLIDKDPATIDVITLVLADEGYDLYVSKYSFSIQEVLDIQPDLILLHNGLDGKGLEFCLDIKNNPKLTLVPVIVSSTRKDIEIIAPLYKADHFLHKPFDIYYLCNLVKETIKG